MFPPEEFAGCGGSSSGNGGGTVGFRGGGSGSGSGGGMVGCWAWRGSRGSRGRGGARSRHVDVLLGVGGGHLDGRVLLLALTLALGPGILALGLLLIRFSLLALGDLGALRRCSSSRRGGLRLVPCPLDFVFLSIRFPLTLSDLSLSLSLGLGLLSRSLL